MKILSLSVFYPRSKEGEITGGVEARNFYINKYLNNQDVNFKVLALKQNNIQGEDYSFGAVLRMCLLGIRGMQVTFEAMRKDFDLIEGTNFATFIFAWVIGRLKNRPIVFWYPDVWLNQWKQNIGPLGIIGEIFERIVLVLPIDKYVTISKYVADKLVRAGIHKDKIKVIYCGVDIDLTRKIDTTRKVYDICAVSRLVSYKRVVDLVKAVEILKKTNPKIKVVIVGQGSEKEKLMNLSSSLGLQNNISFYSYISSHNELLKIIGLSRILCHPSIVEGFGITVIEAASLGVPSVISDIPVLREVTKDGEAGMFSEIKNPIDLASKISLLLNDKSLFHQKSDSALKLSKYYDWEVIAQETGKLYQSLLKI